MRAAMIFASELSCVFLNGLDSGGLPGVLCQVRISGIYHNDCIFQLEA
jgi:hypothetical protein